MEGEEGEGVSVYAVGRQVGVLYACVSEACIQISASL
jgi:hypothetical protein